jgi:hypothetical protein
MITASHEKCSIGKSLLLQFSLFELLGIFFASRARRPLVDGITAPFYSIRLPFLEVASWTDERIPIEARVIALVAALIVLALLAAGLAAWFYLHSRIGTHVAFGLFSLFSIVTFQLAQPYQSSNRAMEPTATQRTASFFNASERHS